jgi:hypothetical protein
MFAKYLGVENMAKEIAIPFFVYKKHQREAFFIVINTSKNAKIKLERVNNDEQGIIQESEFTGSSRYTLGA